MNPSNQFLYFFIIIILEFNAISLFSVSYANELLYINAPTNLSYSLTTSNRLIILTWDDNSSNEIAFRIEKKKGLWGKYLVIQSCEKNATSYTDNEINIGNNYYYRVMAYNESIESNYSNEVLFSYIDDDPPVIIGLSDDLISKEKKCWTWNATDISQPVLFRYAINQVLDCTELNSEFSNVTSAVKDAKDGYGKWFIHVQAKDASGNKSKVVTASAELDCPLNISESVLISDLSPEIGDSYTVVFNAICGYLPLEWSIVHGNLPPNLTFNHLNGNIDGKLNTFGHYEFSVRVMDSKNNLAEKKHEIDITKKLEILTTSVHNNCLQIQESFQADIHAIGGKKPYSFNIMNGNLPDGLSLNTNGRIAGMPQKKESCFFTVSVVDDFENQNSMEFYLETAEPLLISNTPLNNGIVGKDYNFTLSAIGGCNELYEWNIYSGQLAPGINFDRTKGCIYGIPTDSFYSTIVFSVSDKNKHYKNKDFILQICHPIEITTDCLPDALSDEDYSELIRAKGGIRPFYYEYIGELPHGLTFNKKDGIVSGVPTTGGINNISVTLTDSSYPNPQRVTKNIRIKVTDTLTILTPAILNVIEKGKQISDFYLQAGGIKPPSSCIWSILDALPEGIYLNKNSGKLYGIPQKSGDFIFTVQLEDTIENCTVQKKFYWHINDQFLITTEIIPDWKRMVSDSFLLQTKGGLSPYKWTIKNGELPQGLILSESTGHIHGKPIKTQSVSIVIEVCDKNLRIAENHYNFNVYDLPKFTTETIPNGKVNCAYIATISINSGFPDYHWRIKKGFLPEGLFAQFNFDTAIIDGIPKKEGNYPITFEVIDSGQYAKPVCQTYTIFIKDTVTITKNSLKDAIKGKQYLDAIQVSGAVGSCMWEITEGMLPKGLSLNAATGEISGILSENAKSSCFTIRVSDDEFCFAYDEKEFCIYIISDPSLFIITRQLTKAQQKSMYQYDLEGKGGLQPYHWEILKPLNLPGGLSLNSCGILSGMPNECGDFYFSVTLEDNMNKLVAQELHLSVLCNNSIEFDSNKNGSIDIGDVVYYLQLLAKYDIESQKDTGIEHIIFLLQVISKIN
jgi:hypothetical protein